MATQCRIPRDYVQVQKYVHRHVGNRSRNVGITEFIRNPEKSETPLVYTATTSRLLVLFLAIGDLLLEHFEEYVAFCTGLDERNRLLRAVAEVDEVPKRDHGLQQQQLK